MKDISNRDIWVVIPAYNEETVVRSVVDGVASEGYTVVVTDDCSRDRTYSTLCGSKVHLIKHPINLGQGAALQTGMKYAQDNGARIIVTFDSDGQHLVSDIPRLVEPLLRDECDIALGSRFIEGAVAQDIPQRKKLFLKLAVLYTRITTGLSLTDTHNGLRAFTVDASKRIRITQDRMAHASQILTLIRNSGLRWKEIPVHIVYSDYSVQKGQKISNSLNIVWDSLTEVLKR